MHCDLDLAYFLYATPHHLMLNICGESFQNPMKKKKVTDRIRTTLSLYINSVNQHTPNVRLYLVILKSHKTLKSYNPYKKILTEDGQIKVHNIKRSFDV